MSGGGVVWAKVPEGGVARLDAEIARIRAAHQSFSPLKVLAFDPAEHAFAVVDRWGRSDDMPHWAEEPDPARASEMLELSRVVGDVVGVYEIDDGLEYGVYALWRNGSLCRSLGYSSDGWFIVSGEPQPWEVGLFNREHLERALSEAREEGDDEEPILEEFSTKLVVHGARWPSPGAGQPGLYTLIREYLRAPAHGFEPWPKRRTIERAP